MVRAGSGAPPPLSPATVRCSTASPVRTVKAPALGNWMTCRSLRSMTLVTIPASGADRSGRTALDLLVTARNAPRWMVRPAGLNAYPEFVSTIATFVALVQSAPPALVVADLSGADPAVVPGGAPAVDVPGAQPATAIADNATAQAVAQIRPVSRTAAPSAGAGRAPCLPLAMGNGSRRQPDQSAWSSARQGRRVSGPAPAGPTGGGRRRTAPRSPALAAEIRPALSPWPARRRCRTPAGRGSDATARRPRPGRPGRRRRSR